MRYTTALYVCGLLAVVIFAPALVEPLRGDTVGQREAQGGPQFLEAPDITIFSDTMRAATNHGAIYGLFARLGTSDATAVEYCAPIGGINTDKFEVRALVARNTAVATAAAGTVNVRIRDDFYPYAEKTAAVFAFPSPGTGIFEWVTTTVVTPATLTDSYLFCVYGSVALGGEAPFFLMQDSAMESGGVTFDAGEVLLQVDANDPMVEVRQKTDVTVNEDPQAEAGPSRDIFASCDAGGQSVTVYLDAGDSYDPDGDVLSFAWSLDGQSVGTDAQVDHLLSGTSIAGTSYDFDLQVSDGYGGTHADTVSIEVVCSQLPDPRPVIEYILPDPIHLHDTTNDVDFCAMRAPYTGMQYVWRFGNDTSIGSAQSTQCMTQDPAALWGWGGYEENATTKEVFLREETIAGGVPYWDADQSKSLTISMPPTLEFTAATPEWIEKDDEKFNYEFVGQSEVAAQEVDLTLIEYLFDSVEDPAGPAAPSGSALAGQTDTQEYTFTGEFIWDTTVTPVTGCGAPAEIVPSRSFNVSVGVAIKDANNFDFPVTQEAPVAEIEFDPTQWVFPTIAVTSAKKDLAWISYDYWVASIAWTIIAELVCPFLVWPPAIVACYAVNTAAALACGIIADLKCDKAHDPIEPDSDYDVDVVLVSLSFAEPVLFDRGSAMDANVNMSVILGRRAQIHHAAYDSARAKLAGAMNAGNAGWIATHSADTLRYGTWTAEDLEDLLPVLDIAFDELAQKLTDEGVTEPAHVMDTLSQTTEELESHFLPLADAVRDEAFYTIPDDLLSVAVTSPREGHYVRGTVRIDARWADKTILGASGSDPSAVTQLKIDGDLRAAALPYDWKTTEETDGQHSIEVEVQGRYGGPDSDVITVIVDNTRPIVRIDSPTETRYSATDAVVTITETMSDDPNPAPQVIQRLIDGEFYGSDIFYPAQLLEHFGPGDHTLVVEVADAAGNVGRASVDFSACCSIRDDDGSNADETYAQINGSSSAEKVILAPAAQGTPDSASLLIHATRQENQNSGDYKITINNNQTVTFDNTATYFNLGDSQWIVVGIDPSYINQGAENRFKINRQSGSEYIDIGIDTDSDNNRSVWSPETDPANCDGELMIFLEICRAEEYPVIPTVSAWGLLIMAALLATVATIFIRGRSAMARSD